MILKALDAGGGFWLCFLLNALGAVINGLFFFMPSNIGVMEGSLVFLFASLGLNPALGLSLGLTRRLRRVVWIFIGWICLSYMSRNAMKSRAGAPAPVPRQRRRSSVCWLRRSRASWQDSASRLAGCTGLL